MTARLEHPALRGRPIYLDYNATTPIDPVVVEAMTPCLIEEFGNPSSGHAYGAAAQIGLTRARDQVAELIGASDDTMVFTGSGSEADALAIRGAPEGVGALYVRAGVRLRPLIAGGGQEHGIGAGTENIALPTTCPACGKRGAGTYLPSHGDSASGTAVFPGE